MWAVLELTPDLARLSRIEVAEAAPAVEEEVRSINPLVVPLPVQALPVSVTLSNFPVVIELEVR